MAAGGDGGVNGGSNVLPGLFSSLYQTIAAGEDDQKIQALTDGINEFQEIYSLGSPTDHPFSRFISGTKCGLAAKGICGMHVNQPFSGYGNSQLAKAPEILFRLEEKLKKL